ncbi:FecR family protein [Mucilaginibacter sp. BJC16-A38]|uniref:FecR family protein n=1 Tax=Mucilaginibacter phenanthrenivorans TaxID=1234842 RepID=UPI00215812FC|nr:FecR family protein [Mucilaginibacter phenanthrenivorans]MCR8556465.1 FecR family protein [Mucilaginibacter phenanthrenivorans]
MENRYQELAKKWLDKTITPEEQAEFAAWYNQDQDNPVEIPEDFAENEEVLKERILNKINRDINQKNTRIRKTTLRWLSVTSAAAILMLAIGFIYFHEHRNSSLKHIAFSPKLKNDITPGGNKAILTLSNGTKINLNEAKNGVLASQGQTVLKKDKDGRIIYQAPDKKAIDSSDTFNTINIPRGGQFQVVLSDGSKVWLNSSSSITFPTAFSKIERRVTITGEVYFEVAKNKQLPFRVVAGKQTVEVLGTHFNINAYTDESAIKTTLIEGSVKVSANSNTAILKPEQQSTIFNRTDKISISTVDTEDVLAWKNGNFQFESAEIPLIMRQASRWYDVDIKYEGEVPKRRFTGSISRNVNLSELLKMLKYTGINFKIEGKTIIVTP